MTRVSQFQPRASGARTARWLACLGLVFVSRVAVAKVLIDVRSKASLAASAQCEQQGTLCTVQGSLRDDRGEPLANQAVRGEFEATSRLNGIVQFKQCSENLAQPDANASAPNPVRTTETGDFCLRLEAAEPIGSHPFWIFYGGSDHIDPKSIQVELSTRGVATDLEWLNRHSRIEIDSSSVPIEVTLQAGNAPVVRQQVILRLIDEQSGHSSSERFRITETTDDAGIAHFRLSGSNIGSVGAGSLEALFPGTPDLSATRRIWPIFRICNVFIEAGPFSTKFALGERETLSVVANSACAASPIGIVEFSRRGQLVYRSPIRDNRAEWPFASGQYAVGTITIDARYVPPSEGWVGRGDAHFDLVITPPSAKEAVFWGIAAAVLTLWLVAKWGHVVLRPISRLELQTEPTTFSSIAREPPEPGKSGWYGIVIDAHAGHPVAGARLRIERPGFANPEIGCGAVSSAAGQFELPPVENRDLWRLVVEAHHHSSGRWPLPPSGRLTIRLQTNRRAILHAFVAWVQNSVPWGQTKGEPTPAQVTKLPGFELSAETIDWAKNVEEAAFGPNEPDNAAQTLIAGPASAGGAKKAR
jgi:hypothetical protein